MSQTIYSEFVESLKRLYSQRIINDQQVKKIFNSGKLTSSEYVYIMKN